MMEVIRDQYGRTFRTLRVSLLNRCNLGCVYCVAGLEDARSGSDGDPAGEDGRGIGGRMEIDKGRGQSLGAFELLAIIRRLHERLGFETVRLTGGEPLLYPGLTGVVEGLRAMGVCRISLTTNGFLLDRKAAGLKQAGLESINVSLDAIDEAVFVRMSRRNSVVRVIR